MGYKNSWYVNYSPVFNRKPLFNAKRPEFCTSFVIPKPSVSYLLLNTEQADFNEQNVFTLKKIKVALRGGLVRFINFWMTNSNLTLIQLCLCSRKYFIYVGGTALLSKITTYHKKVIIRSSIMSILQRQKPDSSLYLWKPCHGNHSDNCRIILGPKHIMTSPSRVKDFD